MLQAMGSQRVNLAIEQEQQQIRHMDVNKSISLIQISLGRFSLSFLFPFSKTCGQAISLNCDAILYF